MRWALGTALLTTGVCGCGEIDSTNVNSVTPTDPTGWETQFEVCAEVREEATLVPVNLLLTVDRSGSMADGKPMSKWEATTRAVTAFLEAPDAGRLQVALRMWPDDDGCNGDECNDLVCSQPQVPAAPLSDEDHRLAVVDALQAGKPDGNTPLSAVLEGARGWASDMQVNAPDEQTAVLLVTDGLPNGCDESIANISSIAYDTFADDTPVYVVGIDGSAESDVDDIASGGGTGAGYFVGSDDVEADLLEALLDIQGDVLGCTYAFPDGDTLNPDLIRVDAVVQGAVELLPRLFGEAECDVDGWGWFLSDKDRITLCDESCERLQAVQDVSVEIAIGCECEVDEDCPDDHVCEDNACVPCEGDDCPGADTNLGGGGDGSRNVQGGAWNCSTLGPAGTGWVVVLLGVALIGRRRS
ncbi:MAG: hypothetical protein KTR31_19970 [Myxococcales bacterium]|nr:hypothetical protein [Myxococcales bacterium]